MQSSYVNGKNTQPRHEQILSVFVDNLLARQDSSHRPARLPNLRRGGGVRGAAAGPWTRLMI